MNRLLLKGLPLAESTLYHKRLLHIARFPRQSQTAYNRESPHLEKRIVQISNSQKMSPFLTRKRLIKDLDDLCIDGFKEFRDQ